MKTSPSQVNTCTARISKVAHKLLLKLALKNGSSIADELDKKLSIRKPKQRIINQDEHDDFDEPDI